MTELKPYLKVILEHRFAVCAIYEPHPFRNCVIEEAIKQQGYEMVGRSSVNDNEWCWVYYDWCGNPVGLSDGFPEGVIVDKFTAENIGSQSLADYLNTENEPALEAWKRRMNNG